jgi:branched-chain amino acid transport system substrate-binding protein
MRHPLRAIFIMLCLCTLPALAHASELLNLGMTLSLTGKYAESGVMSEKAYNLWERDVNRKGGLLGRPIKLTILDDKSDPHLAKELYQNFIVRQKVDFILGPYSSEITEAVSAVAEQYQYPLLASGASGESLWQHGRKYLFGVYVTTNKYTIGFLELLLKAGFKKIAIVSAGDIFSKGIESSTREWAKRFEQEIVFSEEFKPDQQSLEKSIRAAQSSGAEALIIAGYFNDSVNGLKALRKIGWTPKAYYATVGPAIQKFSDTLKSDADYIFSSSQWESNMPFPGVREFNQSFIDNYQMTPSYHAASAYAAGQILEAAIRKAKSVNRSKITETLQSLDTITIIGRYGVDRTGKQVRHLTTTVQWQNGKKEIVAPEELMTAKPLWR